MLDEEAKVIRANGVTEIVQLLLDKNANMNAATEVLLSDSISV